MNKFVKYKKRNTFNLEKLSYILDESSNIWKDNIWNIAWVYLVLVLFWKN